MRTRLAALAAFGLMATGCSTSDPAAVAEQLPSPTPTVSSAPSGPAYVALGDSYTSAPGVPTTEQESGCLRSDRNYPNLVAEVVDLRLVDVSCSGADTLAMVGAQQTDRGPAAPQLLAVTEDAEVVTLGLGGNDEGLFRELVAVCLQVGADDPQGAPCRDAMATPGGGDKSIDRIEVIRGRLVAALAGIKGAAAPDAKVVLVGYPQVVPAKGTCPQLPLAEGDYAYVRDLILALGRATESAAREAGVGYADVLAASRGHDICAGPDAWVNGIFPNDAAAPLHPFAAEQAAVADLVLDALSRM